MNRLLGFAAFCLLLTAVFVDWIWKPETPAQAAPFNLEVFRREFNQHADVDRLVVLLSPT